MRFQSLSEATVFCVFFSERGNTDAWQRKSSFNHFDENQMLVNLSKMQVFVSGVKSLLLSEISSSVSFLRLKNIYESLRQRVM